MFGLKSVALLLAATGFHFAAAQEPVYGLFYLGGAAFNVAAPLAVRGTQTFTGGLDQCYGFCTNFDDCLGFAAGTSLLPQSSSTVHKS